MTQIVTLTGLGVKPNEFDDEMKDTWLEIASLIITHLCGVPWFILNSLVLSIDH